MVTLQKDNFTFIILLKGEGRLWNSVREVILK